MAEEKVSEKQVTKTRKKGRSVDKWKKKQWYNIIAPNEFDRKLLGETVAEKPKTLLGRIVKVDLGQLTGHRQKRHIRVLFKVVKVEGNNASCEVIGHGISHGFLNRLVRRRMSKIDLVQTVKTSDEKNFKIKAVALSVRKLNRKQETAIRKKMEEMLKKSAQKKPFSQFSQEVIFGVVSSKLFKQLTKVAPLKRVEIIKSRLIEGK
jgi:small subunit ribosomal protein S3Ae